MSHVYTYVTHSERYFPSLIDSCVKHNIRPVVRGMGDVWEGFVKRHHELLAFLKEVPDDDIVINVDGFDTIVLCSLNEIVQKFKAMKCDMLFSMTADNGNMIQKYVQWRLGFYGEKANAGMFMGYAFKMREFIEKLLASNEYNDQIVVNRMLGSIKIDTNQEIFCNVVNTSGLHIHNRELWYKNKKPCVLSAPGCVDLRPFLRDIGIQTSKLSCNVAQRLKEYYRYFIIDIAILLCVVYIVLKRMRKR